MQTIVIRENCPVCGGKRWTKTGERRHSCHRCLGVGRVVREISLQEFAIELKKVLNK